MIARASQGASVAPQGEAPLRVGAGALLGRNALGTWIAAPQGGADFSHPFTVTVAGDVAWVSRGVIVAERAIEPRIGRVPIGGTDSEPQPVVKLSITKSTAQKESWVCVEVTPTAEGKLTDEEGALLPGVVVEVVQRDAPSVMAGKTGRAPLALLSYEDPGAPRVWQVAMFHFRYETVQAAEGPRRHYFL